MRNILCVLALLGITREVKDAYAEDFSLDLSSSASFDKANSTGLWNTVAGRIQAAVTPSGAAITKEIDFGDGSDGAFSDGPTQTGISVNGSTITINTSEKALFQFTSFNLGAGKTLSVTGSVPLVIRVFGNASIAGIVQANGSPGVGNDGGLGNTAGAGPTLGPNSGGASGPGGGKGGDGAATTDVAGAGTNGAGAGALSRGGGLGNGSSSSITPEQGGGGGCNGSGTGDDATPGIGAANAGACSTYAVVGNNFESFFSGGGGGGGGGNYDDSLDPPIRSGGGGGGGGGAINLVALGAITISGTTSAQGGQGGNNNSSSTVAGHCGAGGAGGSGGSIWFQSASSVGGAGSITIAGGTAGTSTDIACVASYDGGRGSRGALRIDTPGGAFSPATPTVTPGGSAQLLSMATPSGKTYTVVSKAIDLSTAYYALGAPTEIVSTSSGCGTDGTLNVTYEGSRDGTNFEHEVSAAKISELDEYPFVRFKVTIQTTGASPPCLTGLTIPYAVKELSELKLKGGLFCGTTTPQNHGGFPKSRSSSSPNPPANPIDALGDILVLAIGLLAGYCLRYLSSGSKCNVLPLPISTRPRNGLSTG